MSHRMNRRFEYLVATTGMCHSPEMDDWHNRIDREQRRFEVVSTKAGLPWIDKAQYRTELLQGARITDLPRIEKLNDGLQRQHELAVALRKAIVERESVKHRLCKETCVLDAAIILSTPQPQPLSTGTNDEGRRKSLQVEGNDEGSTTARSTTSSVAAPKKRPQSAASRHSSVADSPTPSDTSVLPSSRQQGVPCSVMAHKHCAHLLKELDRATDLVVKLVKAWRENLLHPLPFFVGKQNYLVDVAKECAMNGIVSLASSHLRGTSRHLPFFYASTYDALAAASLNITRSELTYILGEIKRQKEHCEEQLALCRMGVYTPVLLNPPAKKGGTALKPTDRLIPLDNKQWKEQLVASYVSALKLLQTQVRQAQNADTATAQNATAFLLVSTRTFHIRAFRQWIEWLAERKRRRRLVKGFLESTNHLLAERRFAVWAERVLSVRRLMGKTEKLFSKSVAAMRQKYISKWFVASRLASVGRAVRRGLYLKYYQTFFYLVFLRRIQRSNEAKARFTPPPAITPLTKQTTPQATPTRIGSDVTGEEEEEGDEEAKTANAEEEEEPVAKQKNTGTLSVAEQGQHKKTPLTPSLRTPQPTRDPQSRQLRSLYLVSMLKPESWRLRLVRNTHTSLRPFLFLSQQEAGRRSQIVRRCWTHCVEMGADGLYEAFRCAAEYLYKEHLCAFGAEYDANQLLLYDTVATEEIERWAVGGEEEPQERDSLAVEMFLEQLAIVVQQETEARRLIVDESSQFQQRDHWEWIHFSVPVIERCLLERRERRCHKALLRRLEDGSIGEELVPGMESLRRRLSTFGSFAGSGSFAGKRSRSLCSTATMTPNEAEETSD